MARPYGGRLTCENCKSIDVRRWHREGKLREGQLFSCSWTHRGEPSGEIIIVVIERDALILAHQSWCLWGSEQKPVFQQVAITWTACRYGGERPWFVCPDCLRRAAVLYAAGEFFGCRHCRGLVYASQQESPLDRSLDQAQKIRFRLGGSPSTFDAFPEKPKRMHRRTYDRLRARGEKLEAIYSGLLQRWLDRTEMPDRARARSRRQTGLAQDRRKAAI